MQLRSMTVLVVLASLTVTGCVTRGRYDEAVRDGSAARTELGKERARLQDEQKGRASMQASLQKQVDEAAAVDDQLQTELKRLGENALSLLAQNGTLKGSLENTLRRLEELRRAQAAADARAALYADLARKLRAMVDAGDLAIALRDGRMVLRLPNDVLFDSGRAELKPAGKRALSEVAVVLRTVRGRNFQVAGHTDNDPIRFSTFRSNWDLSTGRALEVTGYLVGQGMDPHTLSAAGYGEFDPVSSNDTAQAKTQNRRTEISLQPNIDEIVAVPEPYETPPSPVSPLAGRSGSVPAPDGKWRHAMTQFSHILVAVDFGESSQEALEAAIGLSKTFGAALTLTHTCEVPTYAYPSMAFFPADLLTPIEDAAREAFAATLAVVQKRVPDAKGLMRRGIAANETLAVVNEVKPDLVVIGTHGRKGVAHALLGSVAEKIVRLSPVPVLTVRHNPN